MQAENNQVIHKTRIMGRRQVESIRGWDGGRKKRKAGERVEAEWCWLERDCTLIYCVPEESRWKSWHQEGMVKVWSLLCILSQEKI